MYIGIDFDGTIVEHDYPKIGRDNPGAIETMKELMAQGHKLILYTMRSGEKLEEAVDYCWVHGIEFFGVNENKTQKHWTTSPKVYCQIYIDDAALGCPLRKPPQAERPYVDWGKVRQLLRAEGVIK